MIEQKDEERALAMREAKSEAHELRSQVAALAQMIDKLSAEMKSKPTRRTNRRPSITPTASSDEESESESEDEPPTPPPKRRPKKKTKKRKAKSKKKDHFKRGDSYAPGVEYNPEWTVAERQFFRAARNKYWASGTKEAMSDEVKGMQDMQARRREWLARKTE